MVLSNLKMCTGVYKNGRISIVTYWVLLFFLKLKTSTAAYNKHMYSTDLLFSKSFISSTYGYNEY